MHNHDGSPTLKADESSPESQEHEEWESSCDKGSDHASDWLEMKEQNTWYMIDVLQDRLNALNNLADNNKRASMVYDLGSARPAHCDPLPTAELQEGATNVDVEHSAGERCCERTPHALAFRNPSVTQTDAGRKLDTLFQKYREETDEEAAGKGRSKSNKRKVNRLEVKKRERRKKIIQSLQGQLENNSSRYLSRAANSVKFRVKRQSQVDKIKKTYPNSKANSFEEEWPIQLGGHDMNPELLLRLSCEKLVVWHNQQQLLKSLVLDRISKGLFVYMYWFVHCRFFQTHSGAEQRYLLERVAQLYPQFLSLLAKKAAPEKRDLLFRHFPFVLSKAIYLGFRFLCPGNLNLFRGAFQRVLYHSVFRLLTGVDICPGSVEALRLEIYPEDATEEDAEDDDSKQGRLSDVSLRNGEHMPKTNTSMLIGSRASQGRPVVDTAENHPPRDTPPIHMRRRAMSASMPILVEGGDRRVRRLSSFIRSELPRQQQVDFDANQMSPLLQQCLGREGASRAERREDTIFDDGAGSLHRKRRILKRTVPVRHCRTGGRETYRSSSVAIERNAEERERLMDRHRTVQTELRTGLNEEQQSGGRRVKSLEQERRNTLRGGMVRTGKSAMDILNQLRGYEMTDDGETPREQ